MCVCVVCARVLCVHVVVLCVVGLRVWHGWTRVVYAWTCAHISISREAIMFKPL